MSEQTELVPAENEAPQEVGEQKEMEGGLLRKLGRVMAGANYIQKDKENKFHGYRYASEQAIKDKLHDLLVENGVLFFITSATKVAFQEYQSDKGKRSALTDVLVRYEFIDVESGERIGGEFTGTGDDNADKGTYKAITGAIKYILTSTFLIPTGDDPESSADTGGVPPPDNRTITEDQAATINTMVQDDDVPLDKLLEWVSKSAKVKVERVAAIPARMYPHVVRMLEKRRQS